MCSGNVATHWLFPHLRQSHTRYPNRQVLLTTSLTTASIAFDSDMTDILIRLGQAPWPADIVAHRLLDSDLIPIRNPALLRADPPLRRAEDLKKHTLLYSELRRDGWQRWLKMTGLPPLETFNKLKLESSSLVYEAAAEGSALRSASGC
jgi:LysR family glycine cleavage system transcriptional activator